MDYLAHRAELSQLGDHWHQKLHYGSGPWDGDRFLFLYFHPLTDQIELRYELPNQASQLVFKVSLADFDIDKLCARLAYADNRKRSVQEKIVDADKANALVDNAHKKKVADMQDAANEKMWWAVRKDTGNHIAPMTVERSVA